MPEFMQLTERQRESYGFIKDKIEGRGFGPTVREIGEGFDIKSPNGVMCHLKALEKKGLIKRTGFRARAIQLVDHRPHTFELPLLGKVAAGAPLQANMLDERLDFKELFGNPNYFALRVQGQSMIENHIEDGDYVVVRKQETAHNGARVARPESSKGVSAVQAPHALRKASGRATQSLVTTMLPPALSFFPKWLARTSQGFPSRPGWFAHWLEWRQKIQLLRKGVPLNA